MTGWLARLADWVAMRLGTQAAAALNHAGHAHPTNGTHLVAPTPRREPTEWEARQDASYADTCRRVAMIEAAVEALRRERPE